MAKKEVICATGRRKCASAGLRVVPGTGVITVNGQTAIEYFKTDAVVGYVMQPLRTVDMANKIDISANIKGGGLVGQAGALRHGIARAIVKMDETKRAALKAAGMITRDSRVKERKKSGQPSARARFQFSKR